jgi:acylphosphatase
MQAKRFLIAGKVQSVFFRASAVEIARSLQLTGYAKNLPDGRVEVFAQGDEPALLKFQQWLQHGPPMAKVESVREQDALIDASVQSFDVRHQQ